VALGLEDAALVDDQATPTISITTAATNRMLAIAAGVRLRNPLVGIGA
jgi:hypothetical protein